MALLNPGDEFPALALNLVGGGTLDVPSALGGDYAMVLLYRGSWCPYCIGQLRAVQRALPRLEEAGIKVVALSVDDEAAAKEMIDKHELTFPIGYGVDADEVAGVTGAFVNPQPRYLQTTGFVLDPAGRVVISVYSSGPIGSLVPEDVRGLVRYLREH
jgi:peroxiredoxin